MPKLTAATITDPEARQAVADGVLDFDWYYRGFHKARLVGESKAAYDKSRLYARARCAEIINARRAQEG